MHLNPSKGKYLAVSLRQRSKKALAINKSQVFPKYTHIHQMSTDYKTKEAFLHPLFSFSIILLL